MLRSPPASFGQGDAGSSVFGRLETRGRTCCLHSEETASGLGDRTDPHPDRTGTRTAADGRRPFEHTANLSVRRDRTIGKDPTIQHGKIRYIPQYGTSATSHRKRSHVNQYESAGPLQHHCEYGLTATGRYAPQRRLLRRDEHARGKGRNLRTGRCVTSRTTHVGHHADRHHRRKAEKGGTVVAIRHRSDTCSSGWRTRSDRRTRSGDRTGDPDSRTSQEKQSRTDR